MATKSAQTSVERPEHHGALMVPIGVEECYAPAEGLVTVVVEWRNPSAPTDIVPCGYAISDEAKADLPVSDLYLGDHIARLEDEGKLFSVYDLLGAGDGYFRIDDNREGQNWGYFIWLGSERLEGNSFIPGAVYLWFDHKIEAHTFPALTEFDDVVALMSDPGALHISELTQFRDGEDPRDTKASDIFDTDNRIVVWDRSAIVQNNRARKLKSS